LFAVRSVLTSDVCHAGGVAAECSSTYRPSSTGAAPEDVRQWWTHVLTLHRKNRTLNKELKEAERALGEELSEQNFARLRDVRDQLSALDGTEASIEGFGALSGRPLRGL
jgi:DNA primase